MRRRVIRIQEELCLGLSECTLRVLQFVQDEAEVRMGFWKHSIFIENFLVDGLRLFPLLFLNENLP